MPPRVKRVVKEAPRSCPVCAEKFTDVRRRALQCKECQYECCTLCVEKYLLTVSDIHCMNCRALMSREDLQPYFPDAFLHKRLYDHHLNVLVELERSLMPETIAHLNELRLQREAEARRHELSQYLDLSSDLQRLRDSVEEVSDKFMFGSSNKPVAGEGNDLLASVRRHWNDILKEQLPRIFIPANIRSRAGLTLQLYNICELHGVKLTKRLVAELLVTMNAAIEFKINELTTFDPELNKGILMRALRCNKETCPGYLVLDVEQRKMFGECKVCNRFQCVHCRVTIDDVSAAHECDPDLLKTIKMLERTTRPCPNCKQSIEKINGCDQMFCTACNTAFDWKTNMIIQGRIHNPHYFQWLEKQEKENPTQQQPQASREPPSRQQQEQERRYSLLFDDLNTMFQRIKQSRKWMEVKHCVYACNLSRCLTFLYRMIVEFQDDVGRYVRENSNPVDRNRFLREMFYQGQISQQQWRIRLGQRLRENNVNKVVNDHKAYLIQECMTQVFDKLLTLLTTDDSFRNAVNTAVTTNDCSLVATVLKPLYDKGIDLVREYNRRTIESGKAYDSSRVHIITIATTKMLYYGISLTSQGYKLTFASNNNHNHSIFELSNVQIIDNLEYSQRHHDDAASMQLHIANRPDYQEDFKMQLHEPSSSSDAVVAEAAENYTEQETFFRDKLERLSKWYSQMQNVFVKANVDHLLDEHVEAAVQIMCEVTADNWHNNYATRFAECVNECKKRRLRREVLLTTHSRIIEVMASLLTTFCDTVLPMVREKYWQDHQAELVAKFEDVRPTQNNDTIRWYYQRYLCQSQCQCYISSKVICLNHADRDNKHGLQRALEVEFENFCNVEPFDQSKFNEVQSKKWLTFLKAQYAAQFSVCLYQLEPQHGLHMKQVVNGVELQVPRWCGFLVSSLNSLLRDNRFATTNYPKNVDDNLSLERLYHALGSVYHQGRLVSLEEIIYLVHLDQPWDLDMIRRLHQQVMYMVLLKHGFVAADLQCSLRKPNGSNNTHHFLQYFSGNNTVRYENKPINTVYLFLDEVCCTVVRDKIKEAVGRLSVGHELNFVDFLEATDTSKMTMHEVFQFLLPSGVVEDATKKTTKKTNK
jgi:hypothetical protein